MRIVSKGFKKRLLIHPAKIDSFYEALTQLIEQELLVINTNIGVDLYFYQQDFSMVAMADTYKAFASDNLNFKMQLIEGATEINQHIDLAFTQLSAMPLLFKSYTVSLCAQLNTSFTASQSVILMLFDHWHSVLFTHAKPGEFNPNLHHFLNHLQQLYNEKEIHPLLKELIKNAINSDRQN